MKVLHEAYVSMGESGENLETIFSHVIGSHQISFWEEESLIEGVSHNRALYITIKGRDKCIARVLIDNDLELNIFPFINPYLDKLLSRREITP